MTPEKELPKIDQCYLCKTWAPESDLHRVEAPDQTGYIGKPICKACLEKILHPGTGVGTVRVKKIL